jgi:pimeloyl-ACP methyl ester carboxylesterase
VTVGSRQSVWSADRTRIAFERCGDGEPLVLVHGTSADRTRWAGVVPLFEPHFTVYAVDRRGRGDSGDSGDSADSGYAIEREFEDVTAVVDRIDQPVTLLGHSYGAICCLEAALQTAHVRRLILYEPPIPVGAEIYAPGVIERLQTALNRGDREALLSAFITEIVGARPDQLERLRSMPSWEARLAAAHTLVREVRADESYVFRGERWSTFETPTLLLVGGDSPTFFGAATRAVKAALPRATLAVMPGQQHAAMDTAPELFVSEVLRFTGDL